MHHRKAYMYFNFSKIGLVDQSKTVNTNLVAKHCKCKLHKFATCNSNFEKSHLSDMHYSITDIQADFEINRPIRYRITAKKKENISTDDRRPDQK